MAWLLHGVFCDLFNEFVMLDIEFIKFLVERDAGFMLHGSFISIADFLRSC